MGVKGNRSAISLCDDAGERKIAAWQSTHEPLWFSIPTMAIKIKECCFTTIEIKEIGCIDRIECF
jgi:hypothetical protein